MRFTAPLLHLSLALAMLLAVAGCGIKPGHLSPPPGTKNTYPRTYPDPSTDPKPEPQTAPQQETQPESD